MMRWLPLVLLLARADAFFSFSDLFGYVTTSFNFLLGGPGSNTERINYRKHQLLRVVPQKQSDVSDLEALAEDVEGIMFWTLPARNRSTDLLVPPDLLEDVKMFFKERGMEYVVIFKDVQKVIASQNPRMSQDQRQELRSSRGHEMTFKRYHRYADMLHYLEYLNSKYPNLVEVLTIGKSSLGLPIKVAKVSTGASSETKPAIWIDGGVHAREWISPAVVMYILRQLVENFKVNRRIVEGADWYLLPVANPDGYEYTHTSDRFWRKTRSANEEAESRFLWVGESCKGVDLNRNWDFHWGEVGSSDDPCMETYAGPHPFSEPETRAIADFLMDRKERIKLYLTLHAYAQMWLTPWGYTSKKAGDYEDLMEMGRKAVDAIRKVSGTQYKLGPATSLLYPTSGGADDWAKGAAGIKYAYTVELRDDGTYGFLLPASQIVPTGKETFAAIKAIVRAIVCKTK